MNGLPINCSTSSKWKYSRIKLHLSTLHYIPRYIAPVQNCSLGFVYHEYVRFKCIDMMIRPNDFFKVKCS